MIPYAKLTETGSFLSELIQEIIGWIFVDHGVVMAVVPLVCSWVFSSSGSSSSSSSSKVIVSCVCVSRKKWRCRMHWIRRLLLALLRRVMQSTCLSCIRSRLHERFAENLK